MCIVTEDLGLRFPLCGPRLEYTLSHFCYLGDLKYQKHLNLPILTLLHFHFRAIHSASFAGRLFESATWTTIAHEIIFSHKSWTPLKNQTTLNLLIDDTHIKYWSLVFLSCMRSGLMLFIRLSISLYSAACFFKSSSNLRLLSTISLIRDFSFS